MQSSVMSWTLKLCSLFVGSMISYFHLTKAPGLVRDLNPGPLAPEARIIPLDQQAFKDRLLRK